VFDHLLKDFSLSPSTAKSKRTRRMSSLINLSILQRKKLLTLLASMC